MSSARYPDFSSSSRSRTVRMLMVAGIAVVVGTFAGGFSVLAIVSALNGPPRQEVSADGRHTTHARLADGPVDKTAPAPGRPAPATEPPAPPAAAPDASVAAATQSPGQDELTPSGQSHPRRPRRRDRSAKRTVGAAARGVAGRLVFPGRTSSRPGR